MLMNTNEKKQLTQNGISLTAENRIRLGQTTKGPIPISE